MAITRPQHIVAVATSSVSAVAALAMSCSATVLLQRSRATSAAPLQRRPTLHVIAMLGLVDAGNAICMLVPTLTGPLPANSLACVLSGWIGQFTLLASFAWTAVFARVLMLVLARGVAVARIWPLMPRLHALAWGIPLLLSSAPLLQKAIDGHMPYAPIEDGTWCWFPEFDDPWRLVTWVPCGLAMVYVGLCYQRVRIHIRACVRISVSSAGAQLLDGVAAPVAARDGAGLVAPHSSFELVQRLQWRVMRYLSCFVLLRLPGILVQLCNLAWPHAPYTSPAWGVLAMLNIVATGSNGTVNALVYTSHEWARFSSLWRAPKVEAGADERPSPVIPSVSATPSTEPTAVS